MSSSESSVAIFSALSLKRSSLALVSPKPSSTLPRTDLVSFNAGSCSRMPTVAPGAGTRLPARLSHGGSAASQVWSNRAGLQLDNRAPLALLGDPLPSTQLPSDDHRVAFD